MKNYLKTIALITAVAMLWVGCKKDENRIFFEGGTAPSLSISNANIVLSALTETEQAVKFTWSNPNYMFTTGVSSHDVQYALEFDINQDFNSPNKFVTTIARELERTYSVLQLNVLLGNNMRLPFSVPVTVYVRLVSSLNFEGASNARLTSNVVTFRTTPYPPPPLVPVPTAGTLWAIGDAFNSGWDNPIAAQYLAEQAFTATTTTLYTAVLNFKGGGAFKLIQENGVWGTQYKRVEGDAFKGTLEQRDADPGFLGPVEPGRYKMTVDFQVGEYTLEKQ